MIITPERLAEIEAAPREACLFKAEAKELADAYRERDAMLRKPAQPAEPVAVMWLYPDGRRYTMTWVGQDEDRMQEMIAERGLIRRELYAAPPAPAAGTTTSKGGAE